MSSKSYNRNRLFFRNAARLGCSVFLAVVARTEAVEFNVLTYGAIPDDGADDTAGIQAALDAADALAGTDTVYLPAGDYFVDMLRIGGDTLLKGDGSQGGSVSQLRMNDYLPHGSNILRNKNTASGDPNITLEKISFDGRKSSQTNLFLHSVNMENVVGLLVDDCEFHDSQAIGFVIQGDLSVDSQTVVINSSATGNELGFYAQSKNETGNGLRDLSYSNCVANGNTWGFDVYLSQDIEYSDCVANVNVGGTARGFTSDSCIFLYYTHCLAQNNGTVGFAVYINLFDQQQPGDVFFTDCDGLNNGNTGFQIENARDVTLSNVRATGNGIGIAAVSSFLSHRPLVGLMIDNVLVNGNQLHGIFLRGVRDSEVRGSVITNNALGGVFDGLRITDGVDYIVNEVVVSAGLPSFNILIRDNEIGSGSQDYGVRSVANTDYVTLLDNDLTSNVTGPYSLVGANNTMITSPSYEAWTYDWGVDIGSDTNDYDGDQLENLGEYALGGNPTNAADVGQIPTLGSAGGMMVYVYAQRTDDSNLFYSLETTTNLVSPSWTNSGYSVATTNVTGGTLDYVTNTISTTADTTFIRLRIEK